MGERTVTKVPSAGPAARSNLRPLSTSTGSLPNHQRWFVEEDLKLMKNRLTVENWSGKSLEAVQQDFHAKIFAKNLTLAQGRYPDLAGKNR